MELLILLASVIIIFGGFIWYRRSMWKVFAVASSQHSEEIREKHSFLQERHIRCKLEHMPHEKAVPMPNNPAANFAAHTPPESSLQLLVHKDDIEKANEAIKDMSYHSTVT